MRLGASSLSSFLAVGAAALSMAITTPILINAFGRQTFGLWATLTGVLAYTALFDFGFGFAAGRFVGEFRARGDMASLNAFYGTSMLLYGLVFVAVMVGAAVIAIVLPRLVVVPAELRPLLLPIILVLGVLMGLMVWTQFFLIVLHAHQRLPLANSLRIAYWLLLAVAMTVAAVFGWGMLGVATMMASSAAVICAAAAIAIHRSEPQLRIGTPSWQHLRRAISYSAFMFLITLGATVVFQTDNLIIAGVLGLGAVTAYAVAMRMTRTLALLLHKVSEVLFPFYSGMRAVGDRLGMRNGFLLTARLELAGAIGIAIGLVFGGRAVLNLWVGNKNVVAAGTFALIIVLALLECWINPSAVLMAATGGERPMAVLNNLEALMNLSLSLTLAHIFGLIGVIAGTVIASIATNFWWLPRLALRRLSIPYAEYINTVLRPSILPAALAVLLGVALTASLPKTVSSGLVAAVAAVGVYAVIYLRSSAGSTERRWLLGFLTHERA